MTGLPKIKVAGKGSFQPPEPKPLTRESKIGEYVFWDSITTRFIGVLVEWDSNVAIVNLANGATKAVET